MKKLLFCLFASVVLTATADDPQALPEMHVYNFEFKVLPLIGKNLAPDEAAVAMLTDCEYVVGNMVAQLGYYVDLDYNDIKVEAVGDGDDAVVVWQMPEPKEMPMAGYIAFVPIKDSEMYKVFFLEKSINFDGEGPAWVLGTVGDTGHSNYGSVKEPKSAKDFVKMIRKLTDMK